MTTVGEPIEPDVWRWYYHAVGKGEAVIVDTWWQTENGGFLCSTLPALQPMKPGSCGPGVLGIYPVIYDEAGKVVEGGSGRAGNMCIRNPWPGIFQTVWGQPERFVQIYYEKYCRNKASTDWRDWPYFAGDGAMLAADGYFRILGRVDDVINVAGHRLGTKELESACLTIDEIAEAAGVPLIDDLRGRVVEMYVALKPGLNPSRDIEEKVARAIEREIGKIARPKHTWIVADMPKTQLWQDHASGPCCHLQLRRCWRHDDACEPGDRREHTPLRSEREGCTGRGSTRTNGSGDRGDQAVWEC